MNEAFPVIRLHGKRGWLAGRDGVVLSFFIHREHKEVAPAIWRAVQAYVQAIPPHSLNWYVSDDGDMVPLDDKGWEHNRQEMLGRPWRAAMAAELLESASGAGGYQLEYYGRRLDSPFHEDPATAVSFTFPTEYLLEHGPDHLRALAFKLAWELPFSFGYASFAVVAPHGYWGASDWTILDALRDRYPGLDLYRLDDTSAVIGAHARSASWLTFVGQPLLGQLGGSEGLRRALPFPEVSVLSLDSQRVMLSLGEWPDPIDTQKGGIPPQYRALAHRLEPLVYKEHSDEPLRYLHTWLRRLCQ